MAILWEYPEDLANELVEDVHAFLNLYLLGCTTEAPGGYPLSAEAITAVRADAVAAFNTMNDTIDAIKAHAQSG